MVSGPRCDAPCVKENNERFFSESVEENDLGRVNS